MDQLGWNGTASLADWFAQEPYRFEFMQAVRVLEAAEPGGVRLGARGGFAFPPSEVCRWQPGADGHPAEISFALLALDGAFGPLPSAYAEERLRAEHRGDSAFGEFLNLFHHRLLRLLYRIAQMHRPALGDERGENPLEGILLSIAGLGVPALRGRLAAPDRAIPRYASLFGQEARSAHGLERMLADFTGQAIEIRQFLGCWARLDAGQLTRIGRGEASRTLGGGAVLGSRAWTDCAGVEIGIGTRAKPLDRPTWLAFLPGGWRKAPVADLARLYLRAETRFRFRLTVAAAAISPSWLGSARLGHTSFLVTRPASAPARVRCEWEEHDA
jgi:type VI secretion system protein ImpH